MTSAELRKANHKIAEQRRRDCIKKCFEDIRDVLPNVDEAQPSKLVILQKAYEYICFMQNREQALLRELEMVKRNA